MEIFVEVLVAWDPATLKSKKDKGILGPVEAWARTDEEQGRKTLHGHFLFWIEGMNKCRNDFWYGSENEREYARECFAKYADQVMRASYPGFRIKLPCCGVGEARSPREVVSELDLQVRFSCMSFSSMCPTNTSRPNSTMLVTGQGGCGKSTCVSMAQRFCHDFCARLAILFDDKTFTFTSTTGSSAAIFGGTTVHSAAYLNRLRITDDMRQEWRNIKVLVLDEVSFFKTSDVERLDKVLKKLTGSDKKFGGVHIVFSGDFYQLQPGEFDGHDNFFPPVYFSRPSRSLSLLQSWRSPTSCYTVTPTLP